MIIEGFIWFADILDKVEAKHGLTISEVESLFTRKPIYSKIEKGRIKGEDLCRALGQAYSGKYITVFFIYKTTREALVISARNMTEKKRKYYAKRKR
jgi:uncharacterized DUF497 family protein